MAIVWKGPALLTTIRAGTTMRAVRPRYLYRRRLAVVDDDALYLGAVPDLATVADDGLGQALHETDAAVLGQAGALAGGEREEGEEVLRGDVLGAESGGDDRLEDAFDARVVGKRQQPLEHRAFRVLSASGVPLAKSRARG